jgi:hypothetical protein
METGPLFCGAAALQFSGAAALDPEDWEALWYLGQMCGGRYERDRAARPNGYSPLPLPQRLANPTIGKTGL